MYDDDLNRLACIAFQNNQIKNEIISETTWMLDLQSIDHLSQREGPALSSFRRSPLTHASSTLGEKVIWKESRCAPSFNFTKNGNRTITS